MRKKNPPSSLTNPNQQLQLLLWGRETSEEGMKCTEKGNGYKLTRSSVSVNGCRFIRAPSLGGLIHVVFTCGTIT